jgi:uncharacterized protein (DUF4415 family)
MTHPELTDEFFERADLYEVEKRIRRGRPVAAAPKQAVKRRLEPGVLAALRATGDGWQTRISDMLRTSAAAGRAGAGVFFNGRATAFRSVRRRSSAEFQCPPERLQERIE